MNDITLKFKNLVSYPKGTQYVSENSRTKCFDASMKNKLKEGIQMIEKKDITEKQTIPIPVPVLMNSLVFRTIAYDLAPTSCEKSDISICNLFKSTSTLEMQYPVGIISYVLIILLIIILISRYLFNPNLGRRYIKVIAL